MTHCPLQTSLQPRAAAYYYYYRLTASIPGQPG